MPLTLWTLWTLITCTLYYQQEMRYRGFIYSRKPRIYSHSSDWVTLLKKYKCLSIILKKEIDTTLQLKDSIIQQGKVYSTDNTTTKIPGNHQSSWQTSSKLVFILSSLLFIASCKAPAAHFQCMGETGKPFESRVKRDKGVRRISGQIDREDTLSPQRPVSCSLGKEVKVPEITGWQLPDS